MKTISAVMLAAAAAFSPADRASAPTIVVTEALVPAPVSQVWTAWSTNEGIQSWMVAKSEFELRVGATWKTSYNKASNLNDDSAIHHMILAFDPEKMFSFRTVKTPKGFPWPDELAKTWCVVYLEPKGKDQTLVTLRMLGYDESEPSQKMRAFFEQGNKATLDALVKKFGAGK